MPAPNNYEAANSDGLNTAGYRWTRNESGGSEGIFAIGGNLGRKQINTKIDHNFNAFHKAAVSYTYENSGGNAGQTIAGKRAASAVELSEMRRG